jgi:hypothetical protein
MKSEVIEVSIESIESGNDSYSFPRKSLKILLCSALKQGNDLPMRLTKKQIDKMAEHCLGVLENSTQNFYIAEPSSPLQN